MKAYILRGISIALLIILAITLSEGRDTLSMVIAGALAATVIAIFIDESGGPGNALPT